MLKKILCVLILLICFSSCNISESLNTNSTSESLNTNGVYENADAVDFRYATDDQLNVYFDLIVDSVKEYYSNAMGNHSEFKPEKLSMSDNVRKYIEYRFKYDAYRYGDYADKENGEYELTWHRIIDDSLYCMVSIVFPNFGTVFQIIISNPKKPEIVEWYCGYKEPFDIITRANDIDLSKKENWFVNSEMNEILNKCQELVDSIKR
ncbi:MAG: hypothetical protein FWH14_07195 [Oscillospiraceae bacterium]|nr:hypothetical protein [Oscillospiraceae bacterium]